jgi:hypothetical protein
MRTGNSQTIHRATGLLFETPQGLARMLFAPDLVGSSAQIADALQSHAGFQAVDEVVFALPFSFEPDDYTQILTDIAARLGPLLGGSPAAEAP